MPLLCHPTPKGEKKIKKLGHLGAWWLTSLATWNFLFPVLALTIFGPG
jgi:hypothetical protein